MNGKNLLASSLLAVVLLLVVIVQLSTNQGTGTYDSWLDYNEDGKIDVDELYPFGKLMVVPAGLLKCHRVCVLWSDNI